MNYILHISESRHYQIVACGPPSGSVTEVATDAGRADSRLASVLTLTVF